MEVKNEAERKLILAFLEHSSFHRYSDLERATGVSRQWIKKLLKKFEAKNLLTYSEKSGWKLKKNKIKIKRFSWEVLKEMVGPGTLGMVLNFILAFYFGSNAFIFAFGGMLVLSPQLIYTFYKLLNTKESFRIFIKD